MPANPNKYPKEFFGNYRVVSSNFYAFRNGWCNTFKNIVFPRGQPGLFNMASLGGYKIIKTQINKTKSIILYFVFCFYLRYTCNSVKSNSNFALIILKRKHFTIHSMTEKTEAIL